MLSRVSPGQEVTAGDDILNLGRRERRTCRSRVERHDLPAGWRLASGISSFRSSRTEEKLPIGVLILSFPYDENFAARMSSKVEHDVAVAYDGRIVASTLTDSEGRPWANQIAPAQLRRAELDNSSSYLFLETDDSRYFFRFVRLPAPGSTQPLLYGVGMPSSFIENAQRNLFRTVGLGLLAIGFGIAVPWSPFRASDRPSCPKAVGHHAHDGIRQSIDHGRAYRAAMSSASWPRIWMWCA